MINDSIKTKYDVLIIGSGVGGLTCAAILAKQGKSVLLLEKHYLAGGLTHTYKRLGCEWDTGVHYIGEVHDPANPFRILFDYVTGPDLIWDKMDKEYDRIVFPDREYSFIEGKENFQSGLLETFHDKRDQTAIKDYLKLITEVGKAGRAFCQAQALPMWTGNMAFRLMRRPAQSFAKYTTFETLSRLTSNPKLIGVLTGQYGNYGLPPKKSSFFTHALVAKHYMNGGSFPRGGSHHIAQTALKVIKENGGDIRLKSDVDKILIKNRCAYAVKLKSGEVILADKIISTAGAHNTYLNFIDANEISKSLYEDVKASRYTSGYFSLNLKLKGSAKSLSLPKTNLWMYPSYDHDANVESYFANQDNPLPVSYISFASNKDTHWDDKYPESSTVNILGVSSLKWFEKWKETSSRAKDQLYQDKKAKLAERHLENLFSYFPHLKNHVDRMESATPLTMKKYCNYRHGETYGLEPSPSRFDQKWLRAQTPIKNLYLSGQDVLFAGVCGALMSGAITALCVSPVKTARAFREIGFFKAKN